MPDQAKIQFQTEETAFVPRELLPNTAYAPLKGIFDLGWTAWEELPASDFVKKLRRLDDSIIKENSEWIFQLAPMISKSEISIDQLRFYAPMYFKLVDKFSTLISENALHLLRNREVRDIVLRHTAEEVGHSELFADFCTNALGLNRGTDLWAKADLPEDRESAWYSAGASLASSAPELAYAVIPFTERSLPRQHDIMARALRAVYGFESRDLSFFDLHRFVDVYHERFGLWILGKYARERKIQEKIVELVEAMRSAQVSWARNAYDQIRKIG